MSTIVVNGTRVRQFLPMRECIEAMERALRALARGGADVPLRPVVRVPGATGGALAAMPAYLDDPRTLGVKAISVFAANEGTAHDSHQGAVLLFDPQHGALVAIMDAGAITAVRTAAVSGVATRLLARPEAGDLAMLGAGVQAHSHLEAMRAVRPVRRVRVWSRTHARAVEFARRYDAPDLSVTAVMEPREAIDGADLVCTVTSSREPVLMGDWLAQGAHLNVVGASVATSREVDTTAILRSACFVDRRESAVREAGDLVIPIREGAVAESHIRAELGELLEGQKPGRLTPQEITLFKSVGLAVEDLGAADIVYRRARGDDDVPRIDLR
ncbi:MAG TPA: ornithine cyclodeaminase family protein [Gemmatimonadaceae bacterium]|nr:ornithine cyclodeaminase family protein [Gemmatimonadaceae bacterium]